MEKKSVKQQPPPPALKKEGEAPTVVFRKSIGESGFAMKGVPINPMTLEKMNEFLKEKPFLGC
jgi:hypothetical protein